MRTRTVYTVIRDEGEVASIEQAKEDAGGLFDEPGEYLYGGGGEEQIGIAIQVSADEGKTWTTVEEVVPR